MNTMRLARLSATGLTALLLAVAVAPTGALAAATPTGSRTPTAPIITWAYPNNGGFTLWWKPPAQARDVTGYEVVTARYSPAERTWTDWRRHWKRGSMTARVDMYATNGTKVRIKVRATTRAAKGAWSDSRVLNVGAPKPVPGTRAEIHNGKLRINWDSADGNRCGIDRYKVWWRSANPSNPTGFVLGGTVGPFQGNTWSPWSKTGWKSGRLYEVYVQAENKNGLGPRGSLVRVRPSS